MKLLQSTWAIISFAPFYFKELIHSNLRVGYDVITPEDMSSPCLMEVNIEGLSPRQIFILSNLITFTPGTICVDVDDNHRHIWIHLLYSDEGDELLQKLKRYYFPFVKGVIR